MTRNRSTSSSKYTRSNGVKRTVQRPPLPQSQRPPLPPSTSTSPANQGMFSGLLGTVAQGFAFGTGSSIAHKGVDAVLNNNGNNNDNKNETDTNQNDMETVDSDKGIQLEACKLLYSKYQKCIDTEWDLDQCIKYREGVKKCLELS